MSHLLIVGKSFSGLKQYLLDNGHEYTVLQDILATKHPEKRLKNRVVASFDTQTSVIDSLSDIKKPIDGILCVYENYVLPAAWISDYLQLPGLPIEAAEACTDKEIMRAKFSKSPVKISPAFKAIANEDELTEFATQHSFPLILKPANLAKSLLVTKNDSLEELLANYQKAMTLLTSTYAKYAPNRQPKIIVEEFLEGSIHSVDAFIDNAGQPHVLNEVVDYQTGYDIGYSDNFHYSRILPSKLDDSAHASLIEAAKLGCEALGMKSSPAHIEIILTKDGPRIVEIGARNGGYRERMHRLANNIDIPGNHIAIALGNQPDITATQDNACAVLELFPKVSGAFAGISHESELRALSSLEYVSIKPSLGDFVGKSADGYKMCAVIILSNSDSDQFEKDLAFINQHVAVQTTGS